MNPTTKWLAVAVSLALAWALFLATAGRGIGVGALQPPTFDSVQLSGPVDFQWKLMDLDGNPVLLSDFKGRPILLNIWATWCPPCRDEMPSLAKLADNPRIKDKGIAILCISTDETQETLKGYLKDKPWKMTMLRSDSLPAAFQTEGIPATFLIGSDGQIISTIVGAAQWDDISVVQFLEKLK